MSATTIGNLFRRPGIVVFSFLVLAITVLGFTSINTWTSDALYMEVFQSTVARDLVAGDRWMQMPASAYLPDQLLYFLLRLLMPANLVLFSLTMAKIALFGLAVAYFCRRVFDLDRSSAASLAALCSIMFLVHHKTHEIPLFRIEYNHFAPVIGALIAVPWMLTPRPGTYRTIGAFAIGFVCAASSSASLIMLPAATLGALYAGRHWAPLPATNDIVSLRRFLARPAVAAFLALGAGLVAGLWLYTSIANPHYLGERILLFSLESRARDWAVRVDPPTILPAFLLAILERVHDAVRHTIRAFTQIYLLNPVFLIWIVTKIRLETRTRRAEIHRQIDLALLLAFLVGFCGMAVAGAIIDHNVHRYFYALITIAFVNLAVELRPIGVSIAMIFCVVATASVLRHAPDFSIDATQFSAQVAPSPGTADLSACIDREIAAPPGPGRVGVGVRSFWLSNATQIRVGDHIDMLQLEENLTPRSWMQNRPTRQSRYDDFFLATRENDTFEIPFTPAERIRCDGGQWTLLHFGAETQELVAHVGVLSDYRWSRFDLPPGTRNWSLRAPARPRYEPQGSLIRQVWKGLGGTGRPADGAGGPRHHTGPGIAHLGPLIRLPEGAYRAEILYSLSNGRGPAPQLLAGCADDSGEFTILGVSRPLRGRGLVVGIRFDVDGGGHCNAGIEFRMAMVAGEEFWIDNMSITPVRDRSESGTERS